MIDQSADGEAPDAPALVGFSDHETPKEVVALFPWFGAQVFIVEHEKADGLLCFVDCAEPGFWMEVRLGDGLGVRCDEVSLGLRHLEIQDGVEVLDGDLPKSDVRDTDSDRVAA